MKYGWTLDKVASPSLKAILVPTVCFNAIYV